MNWNQIKELKSVYKEQLKKACAAKTKKTATKYSDLAQQTRREIANELYEWDFSGLDFTQFNVMAPVGGPYCLLDAHSFKIESNLGSALQVSFQVGKNDTRYAGYLHWIDNKCGIDNTKFIF